MVESQRSQTQEVLAIVVDPYRHWTVVPLLLIPHPGKGFGPGYSISPHCPVIAVGESITSVPFRGSPDEATAYDPFFPVIANFKTPETFLRLTFVMPWIGAGLLFV